MSITFCPSCRGARKSTGWWIEVSNMKKTYIDERGWQYAVRPGLGHDVFKAFYRKPGKSWHAVRVLAWFASEQEAEADLARWAAKKGMRCMEG